MSEQDLQSILDGIPPGQARRLEPSEAEAVLVGLERLSEQDSGMTGPIRVLRHGDERWILEQDTRRRPVLRHLLPEEDPQAFVADRQAAYERLWDG